MLSKFIINYEIFSIFHSYLPHHYALLNNIWAIHMTLYRVCCIEYTWLLLKAQCYAILCISYSKCIFFFCDTPKPTQLLKNIYKFFSFIQFEINITFKNQKKKRVHQCIGFLHENYLRLLCKTMKKLNSKVDNDTR